MYRLHVKWPLRLISQSHCHKLARQFCISWKDKQMYLRDGKKCLAKLPEFKRHHLREKLEDQKCNANGTAWLQDWTLWRGFQTFAKHFLNFRWFPQLCQTADLRVISCIHLSYNTNIWDPLVFVVYSLLYLQNFGGG